MPNEEADGLLVERVRRGDPSALEVVFRRYGRLLLDVVHGYLAAPDEAEEVVQDLFLWIWQHRQSWTAPADLRPYLLTAVRHRALNRIRHRHVERRLQERLRRPHELAHRLGSRRSEALDQVTGDELSAVVAAAVDQLPPRCREVFLLLRHDELSYREVAETMGISPKTVEIHMTRALNAIRVAVIRWRGEG